MKLFGQYLVEKGLIQEQDLLSALIEQLRGLPTPLELVHAEGLLSVKEILLVLQKQHQSGSDFRLSATILGIWTNELEQAFSAALRKTRVPLGQILVKSGKIDFKAMVNALDEYSGENLSHESAKPPAAAAPVATEAALSTPAPAMTAVTEGILEPSQIREIYTSIESLRSEISNDPSSVQIPTKFSAVFDQVHQLKGLARLTSSSNIEDITTAIEAVIQATSKSLAAISIAELQLVADMVLSATQLIDSLIQQTNEKDPKDLTFKAVKGLGELQLLIQK